MNDVPKLPTSPKRQCEQPDNFGFYFGQNLSDSKAQRPLIQSNGLTKILKQSINTNATANEMAKAMGSTPLVGKTRHMTQHTRSKISSNEPIKAGKYQSAFDKCALTNVLAQLQRKMWDEKEQ